MSSAAFAAVLKRFEDLKKGWASKKLDQCAKILDELKLSLIELALMPTEGSVVDQKVSKSFSFWPLLNVES